MNKKHLDHIYKSLLDLEKDREREELLLGSQDQRCSIHMETKTLYCHQCDIRICKFCRTEFHEDHYMQPIGKLYVSDYDEMEILRGYEDLMKLVAESTQAT